MKPSWTIEIRRNGNNEVVETVETEHVPGSMPYWKMMQELRGRVDYNLYHVVEPPPPLMVPIRRS